MRGQAQAAGAKGDPGSGRPDRAREAITAALVLARGAPMSTEALLDALCSGPWLASTRHGPVTLTVDQVHTGLEALRAEGVLLGAPAPGGITQWVVRDGHGRPPPRPGPASPTET